jgi:arylsulfatase A-like enzyme
MLFDEKSELKRIAQRGLLTRMFAMLNRFTTYKSAKEWIRKHVSSVYNASRMAKTALEARKSPFGDAAQANGAIFQLLAERPVGQPLFLQVQYMDLHAPNLPPDEFLTKFGSTMSKYQQYIYGQKRNMRPIPDFTPEEVEDLILLYDACLAHIDSRIRELFEELKRRDIYDNALIVVSADHGEAFFEHGDLGHHAFLYEENIRVPLLIKYPHGEWGGTERASIARLIDIGVTIVDTIGIARPSTFVGKSLRPGVDAIDQVSGDDHAIGFTAARFSPENFARLNFKKFSIALRTRNRKLMVHDERPEELYHLDTDPREKINLLKGVLSTEIAGEYHKLYALLEPYLSRVRRS